MAFAWGTGSVGWGGAAATATTIPTGGSITVAVHDFIFVWLMVDGAGHTFTVTDNFLNTYVQVGGYIAANGPCTGAIFVCRDSNSAGTCSVTTTIDSTTTNRNMTFGSLSGISTSAAIVSNTANVTTAAGTDATTSAAATPGAQPALVLGLAWNGFGITLNTGTGFTVAPGGALALGTYFAQNVSIEYQRVTALTPLAVTYTASAANANGSAVAELIIPETGGGGAANFKFGGFKKLWAFLRNLGGAIAQVIIGSFGPVFTIPVPTTRNTGTFALTNIAQPGSRLLYADTVAGTQTTNTATTMAQCMFWNGTNIIDASGFTSPGGVGTLYGTDPLNPSGPVNTIRNLSAVLPRSDGSDVGSTSGFIGDHAIGAASLTRAGFADWILVKRGLTVDLLADITAWNTASGGAQTLRGLNVARGKSATERSVLTCYGSTSTERPIYKKPPSGLYFGAFNAGVNFTLYTGGICDGQDRTAPTAGGETQAANYLATAQADRDIHFEDWWFYRCSHQFNIGSGANVYTPDTGGDSNFLGFMWCEGCLWTDTWISGATCQGVYFGGRHGVAGYSFHSCWGVRCGFEEDPTTKTAFNPDGVEWSYGARTVGSRNFYLSGGADSPNCFFTDGGSITGGSGYQCRPGGNVTGNFFYEGYCNIGAASGYTYNGTASSGVVNDNWLQRYAPLVNAGNTPPGHPGWGFQFGGGFFAGEFARNVFSQAQYSTKDSSGLGYGFSLKSIIDDDDTPFRRVTTNNNVHDNIFDADFSTSAAPSAVSEIDGGGTDIFYQWPAPITGNWGTVGQTLTCTPVAGFTGSPTYEWQKNGVAITGPGETSATYVQRVGDNTTTANPGGLRCKVTGISYAAVNTPGLKGNTLQGNVFVNGVATTAVTIAPATGITPSVATDTVYTSNIRYSSMAAAITGQGWTGANRTLKSYLQALGNTVTTVDGAKEHYLLLTTQRRGTIDPNIWSGKKIENYMRAGRNMLPLT